VTKTKMLTFLVILSTGVTTAAFAQNAILGPGSRYGLEPQPGPIYYGRGYYHEYGSVPFEEAYSRSWLERSKPGGHSTARRVPGN
jgi:hypothetical protein